MKFQVGYRFRLEGEEKNVTVDFEIEEDTLHDAAEALGISLDTLKALMDAAPLPDVRVTEY